MMKTDCARLLDTVKIYHGIQYSTQYSIHSTYLDLISTTTGRLHDGMMIVYNVIHVGHIALLGSVLTSMHALFPHPYYEHQAFSIRVRVTLTLTLIEKEHDGMMIVNNISHTCRAHLLGSVLTSMHYSHILTMNIRPRSHCTITQVR